MDEDECDEAAKQADTPDIKLLLISFRNSDDGCDLITPFFSPSSPGQPSSASWPHVSQSPERRTDGNHQT